MTTLAKQPQKPTISSKNEEQKQNSTTDNLEKKLKKLKELHDKRLITQEQYNEQVKKVLDNE